MYTSRPKLELTSSRVLVERATVRRQSNHCFLCSSLFWFSYACSPGGTLADEGTGSDSSDSTTPNDEGSDSTTGETGGTGEVSSQGEGNSDTTGGSVETAGSSSEATSNNEGSSSGEDGSTSENEETGTGGEHGETDTGDESGETETGTGRETNTSESGETGTSETGEITSGNPDDGGPMEGTTGGATAGCELDNFAYTVPLTVENSGDALSEHVVEITIDLSTLPGEVAENCADIRFIDGMGTIMHHWLDGACGPDDTLFWVKLNDIPMGSTEFYLQYGNVGAASVSDGKDTFLFFDDFDDDGVNNWTAGTESYEEGHDLGYSVSATTDTYQSPLYALDLYAYASCGSEPYDGLASYAEIEVDVPDGDYCIDFDTRSDVTGFDYFTGGTMYRFVSVDGTEVFLDSTGCEGSGCTAVGEWSFEQASHSGAIDMLRLGGDASDCIEGRAYFDNVRVRACVDPQPTITIGDTEECS